MQLKQLTTLNEKEVDGVLSIYKYVDPNFKTSDLIFEEHNMITLTSKIAILTPLYFSGFVPDIINSLKVGIGGTVDPAGLYPQPVNSNISNLYNPLLSVSVFTTHDDTVPSVTFVADLDQGTGNGQLINEAGLFKASGAMFNIKTFPGIPKTSEFGLHFVWTIKVS